ncbi:DeoR/GlpR family DNA-binding transcription regulator [Kyrpidia sp.]|uniref:DeoR/GlpR family DNA-binding transcription regulator n=1 Tax=Kyrpidia sp. TaxID=2073077 RepID=UPI002588C14A|nr:DeoR/GlpR family DNA-binding transcription regulator [Kyrpidia sp.]MCL6576142.1 DeoR/GlpR family DNA-binding transcription regulator [Kyrpidia sp.]
MLQEERQKKIMEYLQHHGTLRVTDLVERLGVSRETVRRDLQELEHQGVLRKVHGGAILTRTGVEPTFAVRRTTNIKEKEAIGRAAAGLVEDGDTIFLDLGTTALEVARHLRGRGRITVVTNSVQAALELIDDEAINVYLTGGMLRSGDLSLSGRFARHMLAQFYVDKAFIGVAGISLAGDLTDFHVEEAEVRNMMIERAKEVIVVADHSKFGVTAFTRVSALTAVHRIVTDAGTDPEQIFMIRSLGVEVFTVPIPCEEGKHNHVQTDEEV